MSLSASLLQKICAATNHLCETALNRKSLHKFEKWRKFSSQIKPISRKTRPASASFFNLSMLASVQCMVITAFKVTVNECPSSWAVVGI
jgi:hypothetical protein